MTRYGTLRGNPADYNPSRREGGVHTGAESVEDLLNRFDSPTRSNSPDNTCAVEKVRAWLEGKGMPMDSLQVYEHPEYGTVQIERTGFIEADEVFTAAIILNEGIGYDGEVNYCDPEWVASLPAPESEEESTPIHKTREERRSDKSDEYPCPVDGCDTGFDNVDSLAGHIGGKAPHCDDHDAYGNVRRFELIEQSLRN